MQQHNHNTAILAENEKIKHARYKDDKRKIMSHENNADSNKKKNKNKKQKNQETQATHTIYA